MPDTDDPFERRAENNAYRAGRRDADVDAHLNNHEKRLNAINGSIDRMTAAMEALAAKVETKAAVEEERNRQLAIANEKQISTRMFWVGIAGVCAVLLIGFLTLHVHGG